MRHLTDRLQAIANEIESGETMADIGTDHGFLPIHLWEKGICPRVIMTDISADSLGKARINAETCHPYDARVPEDIMHPEDHFVFRVGNGLEVIKPAEVDTVVIAGMGGILISEILKADPEKTRTYRKLILQPRSKSGVLRHMLVNSRFAITAETLVREGRFICEIIKAEPQSCTEAVNIPEAAFSEAADSIFWEVPPWIISCPLAGEFVENKIQMHQGILKSLRSAADSELKKAEAEKVMKKIEYLTNLIK